MDFNYFGQDTEELSNDDGIYNVLPMFDKSEYKTVNKAILETQFGDAEVVKDTLYDILMDCCCTTEKDSVFDFIRELIEIMFAYDSRKDDMISTLEEAIYQKF